MATSVRGSRRNTETQQCPISYVQMDGLALMKIVKHCHEENAVSLDVAQGALLGLVVDDRLEITNCFPFPKSIDNSIDEEEYQLAMMRKLRVVNVDHLHVGWYQSAETGNFLSLPLLESQFHYQTSIEESVVIIFDTQKAKRSLISIRAYRLSPEGLELYKEQLEDQSSATLGPYVSYEKMFVEVPVVIKNSHLINVLLCELTDLMKEDISTKFLDLGTSSVLETQLCCMMDRVDEQNQESNKYIKHQIQVNKQQQDKTRLLQKRAAENAARQAKGEAPLSEDDIHKLYKPIQPPSRVNPMLVSGQIATYCQQISQFCAQSLSKLYVTEALQVGSEKK